MRLQVESTTASQPSAELARRARAARVGVDGDALPQLDGRLAVRDADEGESHDGEVGQREDDRDEREAGDEQGGERRPRRPSSRRRTSAVA